MEEKNFVRLLVLETEIEANFLKGNLEDNGIHVLVKGIGGSAFGNALDGEDEIEVFVYEEDFEKAKDLANTVMADDGDEIPAWTCKCGEDVDEGFGVCWSCGTDYEGPLGESE